MAVLPQLIRLESVRYFAAQGQLGEQLARFERNIESAVESILLRAGVRLSGTVDIKSGPLRADKISRVNGRGALVTATLPKATQALCGDVFSLKNIGTADLDAIETGGGTFTDTVSPGDFQAYLCDGFTYIPLLPGILSNDKAQYHDTAYSPVGLWQFDGNGDDASGNGFTLGHDAGNELYTYILPGIRASVFGTSGVESWSRASRDASLAITGDVTIEAIVQTPYRTANAWLCSMGAAGETEALNTLYMLGTDTTGRYRWLHENGAGVNNDVSLTTPPWEAVHHLAMVRSGTNILTYVNGKQAYTTTVAAAATGGTDSTVRFRVGVENSGTTEYFRGSIASLKIVASALSAAQVRREYNHTLGPVYGRLSA